MPMKNSLKSRGSNRTNQMAGASAIMSTEAGTNIALKSTQNQMKMTGVKRVNII